MRHDLYAHLQRLPMGFHDQWQSGQLLSRVTNDLSTIRRFLGFGLLFLVINVLQVVVVTALLLNMYWPLGLVVLAASVPIVLAGPMRFERQLRRRLARGAGPAGRPGHLGRGGRRRHPGDQGLRPRPTHVFGRFDERAPRAATTPRWSKVRLSAQFWTFLEVIPNVALIVVLLLRRASPSARAGLTLGTLVAFITLMLSLVWPIASLGSSCAMAQEAMTAADRIIEIFDTEPDRARRRPELVDGRAATLRFEGVGFRFPDSDRRAVLRDVEPRRRAGRDGRPRRRHRLRQDHADRAGAAAVRRHGRADHHRRASTSAT